MIGSDIDSKFIHVKRLKSQSGAGILSAYTQAHNLLFSKGFLPRLQRLDNEASLALRNVLAEQLIDFQLAPPHVHCHNTTE
jgi:hypothetical protein